MPYTARFVTAILQQIEHNKSWILFVYMEGHWQGRKVKLKSGQMKTMRSTHPALISLELTNANTFPLIEDQKFQTTTARTIDWFTSIFGVGKEKTSTVRCISIWKNQFGRAPQNQKFLILCIHTQIFSNWTYLDINYYKK